MVVKPYTEEVKGNTRTRVLQENVESHELVWHRDRNDRLVEVIQSKGWMFQYDNGLPFEIKSGDIIVIPKESYHRVIKGQGDLVIEIKE
jgi:quercetin dioxygenase-like cupin family protein